MTAETATIISSLAAAIATIPTLFAQGAAPLDVSRLVNLAAEVAIVAIFVWYLKHKDKHSKDLATEGHQVVRDLSASFHELKGAMEKQATATTELAHQLDNVGDELKKQ